MLSKSIMVTVITSYLPVSGTNPCSHRIGSIVVGWRCMVSCTGHRYSAVRYCNLWFPSYGEKIWTMFQLCRVIPELQESTRDSDEHNGRCKKPLIALLAAYHPVHHKLGRAAERTGVRTIASTPRTFGLIGLDVPARCMLACMLRGVHMSVSYMKPGCWQWQQTRQRKEYVHHMTVLYCNYLQLVHCREQ